MTEGKSSPNKADMYTHISVYTGAIQTDVNTKGNTGPGWVSSIAVETGFVSFL
jgi:hypothetical protein